MPHSEFWPFTCKIDECNGDEPPSVLQKQIVDMEAQVKEMQFELSAIRRDRASLIEPMNNVNVASKLNNYHLDSQNPPQLSKLKEELIRAKNVADQERSRREQYESKLRDLESKLNDLCNTGLIEESKKMLNNEVSALKIQIRDLKEEKEDLKSTISEKDEQLQEYRAKYLQAEQQVEELKRHVDMIEYDNTQVSEQMQIEIQKMKMQFQEKLQELAPLPDLLKGSQIQLLEAKQLQRLAEDSSQELSSELNKVKEKLVIAVNSLNQERAEKIKIIEENKTLTLDIEEKIIAIDDLVRNVDDFKCKVLRLEEKLVQEEARYKEKADECTHLLKELDELRSENARSLAKCRERSDSMRRHMQMQISELERQLVQSRAQCRSCQKERDDIRQRIQIQTNSLQENFGLVEIRLRDFQNQISSLKNSFAAMFSNDEENTDWLANQQ
ncbi:unnamed protein product [Leptidea sinapis]|uniref:Uncharacterized protein n=1 Tax=Leptidea sinapis TaxID=189913 RepID=A0A5E4QT02_9NEOP|nr:unnamed protein product [Leptidea sinapis]